VLAGRASKSYDNGHVHMGDAIPCPDSLCHYWSYFESMQGTASTLHFSDYQGQAHKIACSKGGQQGDAFETVRFAVTTFPSFGRVFARHGACTWAAICDDVFIVASLRCCYGLLGQLSLFRRHPNVLVELPILPPDHYGFGLGCARFTGTLAAVEENERRCARWLHKFLPEALQRDLFSGDEDELALTLLDIVEPLQYPLSVLQKARRHALASPLLVDGAGC